MINASVICDSISHEGVRLTSIGYTAHRYILAEIVTHRVFSRNARSSRAVPMKRLIAEVREHPAIPLDLRTNIPGMQGGEPLHDHVQESVLDEWIDAANYAADRAEAMMKMGLHKSHGNRVIEPYLYVHGIITATEWDNWFALRDHDAAQPEIRALAQAMRMAMDANTPTLIQHGDWHLPYITDADREIAALEPSDEREACLLLRRLSAARCARISYEPFDGDPSWAREIERADRLMRDGHWSPFEHQATPDRMIGDVWGKPSLHANYHGWIQSRHLLQYST